MTADHFTEVDDHFRRLHEPAFGKVSAAADPHIHPEGTAVVFTGSLMTELAGTAPTRVCLAEAGAVRLLTSGAGSQRLPRFSPDGTLLAYLSDGDAEGDFQLRVVDAVTLEPVAQAQVDGCVESLAWGPDGRAVLVQVAAYGADLAGGQGSGTTAVPGGSTEPWKPEVLRGGAQTHGWRSVWVVSPASGAARRVSAESTNVWEAAWAGPDDLVCVTSPAPGEEAWYSADLRLIKVGSGEETVLYTSDKQLGIPAASPSGRTVAFVEALCSDRQVVAGDLILVSTAAAGAGVDGVERVDTHGADVTHLGWVSEGELGYAAVRGLETVAGRCHVNDAGAAKAIEAWVSTETLGDRYPELSFSAVGDAGVLHSYDRYPELVILNGGSLSTVAELAHPGTTYLKGIAGTVRSVDWTAPDGLRIQGLLCTPEGPGPHPLVVHLHGGPVWAWQNAWSMGFPITPLLVSHGYAVLHPNPRGSGGRGQAFAEAVFGDMGGADMHDVLSGIDSLVDQKLADPDRIGVFGGSYGGFMSAWLITQDQRFAAAAPIAPVTEWYTQHHTSNIPYFDQMLLMDEPQALNGRYVERSPVRFAAQVRTPTLQVAGALDKCTPASQALAFHQALVENDVESVLVTYPGEGHGVRNFPAVTDYCARLLEWFERHMGAVASPPLP